MERRAAIVVTPCDPTEGGGAPLVTRGRLQSLRRLGYDVAVIRDGRPLKAAAMRDLARVVEPPRPTGGILGRLAWNARRFLRTGDWPRWRRGTWQALLAEVERTRPALVLLDTVRTVEYGALLRAHGYGGRILLHEHNVEHDLLVRQRAHTRAWGKRLELALRIRRLRAVESRLTRYADACLALSTVDQALLSRMNPGLACPLVPPAVDTDRYQPAGPVPATPELLFIGSCHWAPNLDGLEWFVREIWPRVRADVPGARLTVVGRGPPAWLASVSGATAEGYVDDERPFYARARVVIVPLRYGSGVRIKILNALAMGRPVVSTPLGAEGIPVVAGESIEIADNASAFAALTVNLLTDDGLAQRLADAGRRVCETTYAPASVDERLEEAFSTTSSLAVRA